MAALTKPRLFLQNAGLNFTDPVAAGVLIYEGALVVLSAAGFAQPGFESTDVTVRGIALTGADNSAGMDGSHIVMVRKGTFALNSDGSITRSDIGKPAYIVDDQTVSNSDGGGTRSVAGQIVNVDDDGVWVNIQ